MTTAITYDQIAAEVVNTCKRTVGYSEARDKAAYLVGVNTAAYHIYGIMQAQVKSLQAEIDSIKQVQNDMETISRIITKYSYDNQ